MEPAKAPKTRLFRSKEDIIRLLAECDQSRCSIKAFCDSHKIAPGTFYNWKQRYSKNTESHSGFAALQVIPSAASLFAEVGQIKIYQPVSTAYLKELL
ncbi:IS66 family insertion sequence element accessory protein TnpA [Longitalea luteola]|uniref:IS66 family insertion sequence element accessory protein TnpA n=1 Tax=Longitalea luteola TaxID=2812563 RepID=UPI0034E236F4